MCYDVTTCLTFNPTTSDKCANPYTLWLADTNNDVMKINNEKLQQLLTTSPTAYRIISRHSPVGALTPAPNELTKQKLHKINHDKYCLPFIDLAVGARVLVTKQLKLEYIMMQQELLLNLDFLLQYLRKTFQKQTLFIL